MSLEELHAEYVRVGNQIATGARWAAEGGGQIGESWQTLSATYEGSRGAELSTAVGQLALAYDKVNEALNVLSQYGVHINPYLARLGLPLIEEVAGDALPTLSAALAARPETASRDPYQEAAKPYLKQLRTIREQLKAGAEPSAIAGYVASGSRHHVFDIGDGVVMKLQRHPDLLVNIPDTRLVARASQGAKNLEQIIGYTTRHGGAVFAEYVPGKTIEEMSEEELAAIPDEPYLDLARAFMTIAARSILPDYSVTNTKYSPETGFVFIDNDACNHKRPMQAFVSLEVQGMGDIFGPDTMRGPLPVAAKRFFAAYRQIYGEAEASRLQRDWPNLYGRNLG